MQATPYFPAHWQAAARMAGERPMDFGDVRAEYDALVHGTGLLDRSDSTKLILTGDDRFAWLQGQITNDLRTLEPGGWIDFFVCTPTGQVIADCLLWDEPGRYVVIAHSNRREALLQRLNRMLIMEDVTIEDATDSYVLLTVTGGVDLDLPGARPTNALRSYGRDVLVPVEGAPALIDYLASHVQPVGLTAYETARIEDAIPVYGMDIDERTLPQELGPISEASHISYTKGCYTGQETIMRIHSRGHTNKTLVGLRTDTVLTPGETFDVGVVNSSCHSIALDAPIALATVKNDFTAVGTELSVGRVVELPFVNR